MARIRLLLVAIALSLVVLTVGVSLPAPPLEGATISGVAVSDVTPASVPTYATIDTPTPGLTAGEERLRAFVLDEVDTGPPAELTLSEQRRKAFLYDEDLGTYELTPGEKRLKTFLYDEVR